MWRRCEVVFGLQIQQTGSYRAELGSDMIDTSSLDPRSWGVLQVHFLQRKIKASHCRTSLERFQNRNAFGFAK